MLFCVCTDITIFPAVEGVFSVYRYNKTASGGVYDVFSVYRYNNTASGGVYVFSAYSTDISILPVVECM